MRTYLTATALGLFAATGMAHSATLLSDGTMNVPGDVTRIDNGDSVLEFLDWSATVGQSVSSALADYESDGFAVATEEQVAALFDAFGMTYAFDPGSYFDLTSSGFVTGPQAAAFVASLGESVAGGSLAIYKRGGNYVYSCISNGGCAPNSFTNDQDYSGGDPSLGVALVRTADPAPVPLPLSIIFLATALAGSGAFTWMRRSKAGPSPH